MSNPWKPRNREKRGRRFYLTGTGCCIEALEGRELLSGVTLITHGFQLFGTLPSWVNLMADAVAGRLDPGEGGASVSRYTLSVPNTSSYSLMHTTGPNPGTGGNDADIVVEVNWASISNQAGIADEVGLQVAAALEVPPTDGSWARAFAQLPLHFIGHSRGAYVDSAAIKALGQEGIWTDYNTTLDPATFGSDGTLGNWSNIRFADNVYQTSGSPSGFAYAGAETWNLTGLAGFTGGGSGPHSRTHTWYHGTIDLNASSVDGETINRSGWYGTGTGQQPLMGFDRTLIVGDVRPSAGLAYAGAARDAVTITATGAGVWDDVEIDYGALAGDIVRGRALNVGLRFADGNRDATITVGFDTDSNPDTPPLGGASSYLTSMMGGEVFTGEVATAAVGAGEYYVCARISNGTRTRYFYSPRMVTVTEPVTLTITGDQDYAGENDTVRLARNGGDPSLLDVFLNNGGVTPSYSVYWPSLQQIVVNTLGGDDEVIVQGDVIPPNHIVYDGGAGGDRLSVVGSGAGDGFGAGNAVVSHGATAIEYAAEALSMESGVFTLAGDAANLNVQVNGGGKAVFDATQHLAALSVEDGGAGEVTAGGAKVLRVGELTLGGSGTLDLNDNALLRDYAGPSPLLAIKDWIKSAWNGGAWNGAGISTGLGNGSRYGLGFGEVSAITLVNGKFFGETITGPAVAVRYTLYGDANLDGKVDIIDLGKVGTHWQSSGWWTEGDSNYGGFVDIVDLGMVGTNWQQMVSGISGAVMDEGALGIVTGRGGIKRAKAYRTTPVL